MTRIQFLGNLVLWSAIFYLASFMSFVVATEYNIMFLPFTIIPAGYSFYRLLLSGYKRAIDILPGKDVGLILIGFIILISIVPFGILLLALLPGNLMSKFGSKHEN